MEKNKDYIDKFINEIKNPFKKWFENDKKEITLYQDAIYQGYLDACRTFRIGKNNLPKWEDLAANIHIEEVVEKNKHLKMRNNKIEIVGEINNYEDFDETHGVMCRTLMSKFENKKINITYGQAQKIINMAFKYLYCYDYCKNNVEKRKCYRFCHMPLDSYTLSWYKRQKDKITDNYQELESGDVWSKLNGKGKYEKIQKSIRELYSENILEREFEIWDQERKSSILSDIKKGINNCKKYGYLKDEKENLMNLLKTL